MAAIIFDFKEKVIKAENCAKKRSRENTCELAKSHTHTNWWAVNASCHTQRQTTKREKTL